MQKEVWQRSVKEENKTGNLNYSPETTQVVLSHVRSYFNLEKQ